MFCGNVLRTLFRAVKSESNIKIYIYIQFPSIKSKLSTKGHLVFRPTFAVNMCEGLMNSLCIHILVERSVCPTICRKLSYFLLDMYSRTVSESLRGLSVVLKTTIQYCEYIPNFVRRLFRSVLTFLVLGCKSLYQLVC